jgi:hypothetical protein
MPTPTPPEEENTGEHTSNTTGKMVEQIVGNGQLDASNASHVCFWLWPVETVLEVDDAGRRPDVAAASAAPVATTALAGMVAEMGGEGLEKELAGGIGQLVSTAGGRARDGQGRTREDARAVWPDANLAQI